MYRTCGNCCDNNRCRSSSSIHTPRQEFFRTFMTASLLQETVLVKTLSEIKATAPRGLGEVGRASHNSIQSISVKSAIREELRSVNSQNLVSVWEGFEKVGRTTTNREIHRGGGASRSDEELLAKKLSARLFRAR